MRWSNSKRDDIVHHSTSLLIYIYIYIRYTYYFKQYIIVYLTATKGGVIYSIFRQLWVVHHTGSVLLLPGSFKPSTPEYAQSGSRGTPSCYITVSALIVGQSEDVDVQNIPINLLTFWPSGVMTVLDAVSTTYITPGTDKTKNVRTVELRDWVPKNPRAKKPWQSDLLDATYQKSDQNLPSPNAPDYCRPLQRLEANLPWVWVNPFGSWKMEDPRDLYMIYKSIHISYIYI